jgi:segregation and condensation protein A
VPYEVSTPVFEGPFDLLLHLINAEQVDLYEISISRIVDAYLEEMARMESLDLEVATEFALIAATLIELKCRRLLPGRDDIEMDEEIALWEERDLLLARLLECKTFKDASSVLADLIAEAALSTPRRAGPDERFADLVPDLLEGVTPEHLRAAFTTAATPRPQPRVDLSHVSLEGASVADAVTELVGRLPTSGPTTFRSLTAHLNRRIDVIVRFLAVLELYKRGLVELDQGETFGRLSVVWTGPEDAEAETLEDEDVVSIGEYQG